MIKVKHNITGSVLGDFVRLTSACDYSTWHPSTGHGHITMVVIKHPDYDATFDRPLSTVGLV